jgi:hypothetical protein
MYEEDKGSYIILILNDSGIKSFFSKTEHSPEHKDITASVLNGDNNLMVGIDELWVETNSGKHFNITGAPKLRNGEKGDALEIRATGSKLYYQFKTLYQDRQISYERHTKYM